MATELNKKWEESLLLDLYLVIDLLFK